RFAARRVCLSIRGAPVVDLRRRDHQGGQCAHRFYLRLPGLCGKGATGGAKRHGGARTGLLPVRDQPGAPAHGPMNTRRLAVIDLGSNTFHLLICDVRTDGTWTELYRERRYVKLAAGGLDHLDEDRISRAVNCMIAFAETARTYPVTAMRATGTAAMREAGSGAELARRIHAACGIPIEIIDGQAEAGYILKGIQAALPPVDRPALVMDIGGGS